MLNNYPITAGIGKPESTSAGDRLALIQKMLSADEDRVHAELENRGRNALTRTIDTTFRLIRSYVPPLHWLGIVLGAIVLFFYARLVAATACLRTSGEADWPEVPAPSVLALWHRDAPTLLVALAKRRPSAPVTIMVAGDPRGDCLALLCRMLGLRVVRGSSDQGGWEALFECVPALTGSACVIITADGGGPARIAKFGAVALSAVTSTPLVPIVADCHPAIEESNKWDAARNPLPFSSLHVRLGAARRFDVFADRQSIESARVWLEERLNQMSDSFTP